MVGINNQEILGIPLKHIISFLENQHNLESNLHKPAQLNPVVLMNKELYN